MRKMWLVLSGLAILTVGCSHPGTYWQNRAVDFSDCFRGEVGTGYGLDVQVGATDWLATGFGASSTHMVGFVGRHPVDPGHDNDGNTHFGFPAAQIAYFVPEVSGKAGPDCMWLETWCCMLLSPLADFQQRNAPREKHVSLLQGTAAIIEPDENCSPLCRVTRSEFGLNIGALLKNRGRVGQAPGPKLVDAFEVDVGATLGVLSARAGFSFGQFADFALGFFGLDIAGDDKE